MNNPNTCCSLNNDHCVLNCTDPNNCCILDTDLDVDPILDPSDLLPSDIKIPQFPAKIKVNDLEEIPTLDELLAANFTEPDPTIADPNTSNKNLSYDEMQTVMHDIEDTVNFTSMSESMDALNNPDILFSRIQSAFDTFKEKTGRQMSYSEMRYMMG